MTINPERDVIRARRDLRYVFIFQIPMMLISLISGAGELAVFDRDSIVWLPLLLLGSLGVLVCMVTVFCHLIARYVRNDVRSRGQRPTELFWTGMSFCALHIVTIVVMLLTGVLDSTGMIYAVFAILMAVPFWLALSLNVDPMMLQNMRLARLRGDL